MRIGLVSAPRVSPPIALPKALREWPGKHARRHDCGQHGRLTVHEISQLSGVSKSRIYNRIRQGVQAEALCAKAVLASTRARKRTQSHDYRDNCDLHVAMACQAQVGIRLALRYGRHAPTAAHLMADYGMSRATAYRMRRAYLDALGEP